MMISLSDDDDRRTLARDSAMSRDAPGESVVQDGRELENLKGVEGSHFRA